MVTKLLVRIQKFQSHLPLKRVRPIMHDLLVKLMACLPQVMNPAEAILYVAIFNVFYYSCLSIGEAVLSTEVTHMALITHLKTEIMLDSCMAYRLFMPNFKHSRGRKATWRL